MKIQALMLLAALPALLFAQNNCPTAFSCDSGERNICLTETNRPEFWRDAAFWDAANESRDLAETAAKLQTGIISKCPDALEVRCVLQLDLDGDGVPETEIDTDQAQTPGVVSFGNMLGAGTPATFDSRPVPLSERQRFVLQLNYGPGVVHAALRWNTQSQPGKWAVPLVPAGRHVVRWTVREPSGETQTCQYVLDVRDCRPPRIVCINGLSASIFMTSSLTLWDSDFLQYMDDNVTPSNLLVYGMRRAGEGTGFPVDSLGQPVHAITFTCDDLGPQEIELWGMDQAGNATFCTTTVVIQDNTGVCAGGPLQFCARSLCTGEPVEEATAEFYSEDPLLPPVSLFDLSDNDGCFTFFTNVPVAVNWRVSVQKDASAGALDANDLGILALHLDGTQPFTEPWQWIAADVDKNGLVDQADYIMLAQWLAGIGQSEWRFFVDTCVFVSGQNPLGALCPEVVVNLTALPIPGFVGVPLGDLDCSAPVRGRSGEVQKADAIQGPFPNPSTGAVYWTRPFTGSAHLSIHDAQGRLIFSQAFQADPIRVPAEVFPQAGMYSYRLQTPTANKTGIVVIR